LVIGNSIREISEILLNPWSGMGNSIREISEILLNPWSVIENIKKPDI